MTTLPLLTTHNPKILKGEKRGWKTAALHLAPSTLSGFNVCPFSSPGCEAGCLNKAGRGVMPHTQDARIRRTRAFRKDPTAYVDQLAAEILRAKHAARKNGQRLAVRLNATSDLPWENIKGSNGLSLIHTFQGVQFYDYTKNPLRALAAHGAWHDRTQPWPANYYLTFSLSEQNMTHAQHLRQRTPCNIAVVAETTAPIARAFPGARIISGDDDDLRFLDPTGCIIHLKPKGPAKRDTTGFVLR